MSQERKAKLAPAIKAILKKYNVKGTIAVRSHMSLVVNIKSGEIDFIKNFNDTCLAKPTSVQRMNAARDHIDVNPYWYHEHFSGAAKRFLTELFTAMNDGNHDNSDIQSDYFDVGWYVDVNIGQWNKPYLVE